MLSTEHENVKVKEGKLWLVGATMLRCQRHSRRTACCRQKPNCEKRPLSHRVGNAVRVTCERESQCTLNSFAHVSLHQTSNAGRHSENPIALNRSIRVREPQMKVCHVYEMKLRRLAISRHSLFTLYGEIRLPRGNREAQHSRRR